MYIWEDYISEQIIESFHKETGIRVNLLLFDSDQARDETIASMNSSKIDLVIFDSISAQIFGKNNRLIGLSESKIPNLKNVDTRWKESCGNFGLPYFYGTIGIVYDKTRVTSPPANWKHLLKPEVEHSGHIVMAVDSTDTLIPALLFLGYNINSENQTELQEAYQVLESQIPHVLAYQYALTYVGEETQRDQVHMGLAYSGDQYALNDITGTENWQYVIPEGPPAVWVDCMSIPATSSNKEEAIQFLNYLARPEIAAINSEEIYNPTPIGKAKKHMPKEIAEDQELFLPEMLLQKAQWYRILSSNNMRQRKRILDSILKRHEAQH